jgi:predicted secreted hydrolase
MNIKVLKSVLVLFLLVFSVSHAGEYADVKPGYSVKIPDDFYYQKDYRVQWWYFTGHLFTDSGREFGYEIAFFVVNVQQRAYKSQFGVNDIYISHFAVSDILENKFYFDDKADAGSFGYAGAQDDRLNVWVERDTLGGTVKNMALKAYDKDKTITVKLRPKKPVILNGEKGYSRKSETSPLVSSIYFSYTNIETEGIIRIGDREYHVKGKSWFDRELSSRGLDDHQEGWDWFAIQLDDNREVMLYVIRNKDGTIDAYSTGTFVYPDGQYRRLLKEDFSVEVLDHYTSEKTGARYPVQWAIEIPSEKLFLRVTPLMKDQEVIAYRSTGNYYWEGTCSVEGDEKGRAYVEMTGY